MTDYAKLIPELTAWNNCNGIDVESWIGCSGNFKLAVGYSTLFWPAFVEFEDYVLREGFTVDALRAWERQCGADRQAIESVMNHLHIADTHFYGCPDLNRDRVVHLGRTLREIYIAKLAWQFPERSFSVSFDPSDCDNPIDCQLTFFQNGRNV